MVTKRKWTLLTAVSTLLLVAAAYAIPTMTSPNDGQWCGKSISCGATAAGPTYFEVDFDNNGSVDLTTATDASSPYSANFNSVPNVPLGTVNIIARVRAVDGTGPSPWRSIKIDNTTPSLPVLTAPAGGWVNSTTPALTWTASLDGDGTPNVAPLPNTSGTTGSGIYGYNYKFDKVPTTVLSQVRLNANLPATASFPTSGDWYIHVIAGDGNYNVGGRYWTTTQHFGPFQVDVTPPTITCPTIAALSATEAGCGAILADYTADVVASDANSGVDTIAQDPLPGSTVYDTDVVTFTVTDVAGNTATCSVTLSVVDDADPTITACAGDQTVVLDVSCLTTVGDFTGLVTATDGCGAINVAQDPIPGTSIAAGPHVITFTVDDGNGNTATCTATLYAYDQMAPVAACKDITVSLDANGLLTLDPAAIDDGSSDNCGSVTLSADPPDFSCAQLGPNAVTLIVDDGHGNTATCVAIVNIIDTTAPVAQCQSITVSLDVNGEATISEDAVNDGSTDNCGIDTIDTDTVSFTCANIGPNTVTMTVTDNDGNSTTCQATVTVIDDTPPVAACQNVTVFLDVNGEGSVAADVLGAPSTDNCGVSSYWAPAVTYTCANLGDNEVIVTVSDASGNSASCTATVKVVDTIAPTAICQDATVVLDPDTGVATLDAADLDNGSFDNTDCGLQYYTPVAQNSYASVDVPKGILDHSLAVSEVVIADAGTVLDVNVSVDITHTYDGDLTLTLVGPDNTRVRLVQGVGGSGENFTATVFDSQAVNPISTGAAPFTGTWQPAESLAAFNGKPLAGTWTLEVLDDATEDEGTLNSWGLEITIGNSSIELDCADLGTQAITLAVVDGAGNTGTCTSNVTVVDNTPPTAFCQSITVALDVNGEVTINAADLNNGSADNCDVNGLTYSADPQFFTCANLGANTVTLTVADSEGNSSSCVTTVNVIDETAPVASCQNITVYLNADGELTIADDAVNDGSTDACGNLSFSTAPRYFTCADVGSNMVLLTVTDASGNASMCPATVTVVDNTPPVASCQNITVWLDGSGNAAIDGDAIDDDSTDACGIANYSVDVAVFDCTMLGGNLVTMTLTDVNGNTSSCQATVNVVDAIAPTPVCADITVFLDENGVATIADDAVDNGSTDNCAVDSYYTDITSFSCDDVNNPVAVTLTVADGSGNSSSCAATVTVLDNLPPVVSCENVTVYMDLYVTADAGCLTSLPDFTEYIDFSDNCGGFVELTQDPLPGTNLNIGEHPVTFYATDAGGNSASCQLTYTVYGLDLALAETDSVNNNGRSFDNWVTLDVNLGSCTDLQQAVIEISFEGTAADYVNGSLQILDTDNMVGNLTATSFFMPDWGPNGYTVVLLSLDSPDGEVVFNASPTHTIATVTFRLPSMADGTFWAWEPGDGTLNVGTYVWYATMPDGVEMDHDAIHDSGDYDPLNPPSDTYGMVTLESEDCVYPLDVDHDGMVSAATDGLYIYRLMKYGDYEGLIPIVPQAVRDAFPTDGFLPSDAVLCIWWYFYTEGEHFDYDVDGDHDITAATDGVYIYRNLMNQDPYGETNVVTGMSTLPAGHQDAKGGVVGNINNSIDALKAMRCNLGWFDLISAIYFGGPF